jgi:hypothetical protein
MCCKGALSTPLKRSTLMWSFSWHYEGMKEDAFQKDFPAPDEAVVRELVLAKNVEAPDLATEINKEDRSEVYDVSIFHHLMARPDLILTSGSEKSCLRKASSLISRGQSIILPNAMFVACYEPHGRKTI